MNMIHLDHITSPKQQQGLESDHKMMPWPSLGEGDMGMGVEGMGGDEDDFDPNQFLNVGEDDEDDVLVNGVGFGAVEPETTTVQPPEGPKLDGETARTSTPTVDGTELEADRSSSLSPVPADAAEEKPADSKPPLAQGADALNDASDGQKKEGVEGDDDAEKFPSRMSTPLSPLSPPPEDDDEPSETNGKEEDKKEHDSSPATSTNTSAKAPGPSSTRSASQGQGQHKGPTAASNANSAANNPNASNHRVNIGNPEMAAAMSGKMGNVPSSASSASTGMTPQQLQQLGQQGHHPQLIANSVSASSSTGSQQFGLRGGMDSFDGGVQGGVLAPTHPDGTTGPQKNDPKAALMLELNAELLNICMAFQQRGIPQSDLRFQQYTSRLQANLAFLANAVDNPPNQQQQRQVPHPPLEPPPPLDFMPTDRIRQIYAELPTAFAKEIARRQQMNMMMSAQQRPGQNVSIAPSPASAPTPGNGGVNGVVPPNINASLANSTGTSSSPSPSSSNHLKRERTEEHMAPDGVQSISNKRRDTGENKGMMPPPTSIPIASEGSNSSDSSNQQQAQQLQQQQHQRQQQMQAHMMQQRAQQQAQQQQQHQNGAHGSPRLQQPTPGQPGPQGPQRTRTPSQQRPASQQSVRPNSAAARQSPVQRVGPSPGPGAQQGQGQQGPESATSPSSMMGMSEAQMAQAQAQRAKQMSMRAAQQQGQGGPMGPQGPMGGAGRQLSPPGAQGMGPPGMGGAGGGNINISGQGGANPAGGMGGAGGSGQPMSIRDLPPSLQQAYQILQTPGHPFAAHAIANIPNFRQLPLHVQLQRMVQLHQHINQEKARKEQALRQAMLAGGANAGAAGGGMNSMGASGGNAGMAGNAAGGMGMALGGGGSANPAAFNQMSMGMGGGNAPSSPVAPQQNLAMFGNMGASGSGGMMGGGAASGTMDPRMLQGGGGVPGTNMGGGMNMNMTNMSSMSPQQQQQLMLMQRARMGGAGGPGGGGMGGGGGNPQNMALIQDQRLRALQEQRAAQQQAQLQSMQMGSPMLSQQNIAAIGGGSGMGGGMGGMGGGTSDFPAALRSNPQVQGISRNAWSPTGDGNSTPSPMTPRVPSGGPGGGMSHQEYQRMILQQQQLQAARTMNGSPAFGGQQGAGGMPAGWQQKQQQQAMMGGGGGSSMSPQGNAAGFGGGNAGMAPSPPNSAQGWAGATSGGYPFAGSPGMDPMRNMSATPGPQQGGGMMGPPQMGGDAGGGGMGDFDLFNWNGS